MRVDDDLEVLSHTPPAIDLSRSPIPVLEEHSPDCEPIGFIDGLRIAHGKLLGNLRLIAERDRRTIAPNGESQGLSLSVAFDVLAFHFEGGRRIVTRWRPYEVSIVKKPADVGAGILPTEVKVRTEESSEAERERCLGISVAGRRYAAESDAITAIEQGESLSDFRQRAILKSVRRPAEIGMSRGERSRYSIARAIGGLLQPMRENSFEREVHSELSRIHGEPANPGQILLPYDVFADIAKRDLVASVAGAGGYLVESDGNSAGFVELVRPRSVALTLGAETIEGLVGNLTVPRVAAGASITWHANESTAPSEGSMTLGQVTLTPKIASANVEFSRQLLLQSNPSSNRVIASDLLRAMAAAVDQAVLGGTGASGQPSGVLNTSGIGTVNGTTLALAGVLEFQTDVGDNLGPQCGYATTRAVAATLAARQKATGTSSFLWEGSLFEGQLGGFRAMTSGNIPTGALVFGDWPAILVASWGTLSVELNPFSNFAAGIVAARALHAIDLGVRRVGAFSAASTVS